MGDLALARDRPNEALEPLHRALETWQRLRLPLEAVLLYSRLGQALYALGDPGAAEHPAACDRILRELGLDEQPLQVRPPVSCA